MRTVLVAFATLLFGCSENGPLHGDVAFTADERVAVEQADSWLAAKVGDAPIGIVWDLAPGDDAERTIRRGPSPGARGSLGNYADRRITIDADRVAVEGDMAVVAAHEIAHLRGIDHHAHAGLMSPGPSAMVWTAADETACLTAGVCH